MEHDFFIHGKPNNADFYGSDNFNGLSEKIYNEFFSSNTLDNPYLQAEIREWKGNHYSVYTYYVPNQRDTSNRPSYFAITLITKGMACSRLNGLYKFFGQTYGIICNKIKLIDQTGKFSVNYFKDVNVAVLPDSFLEEINKRFGNEFVAIPDKRGDVFPDGQIQQFNPEDGDFIVVQSALLERGKILLSKEAETFVQKVAKIDQLADENERLKQDKQVSQNLKTENESLKSQLNNANQFKLQLQGRVDELEKQVNKYREAHDKSERELRFLASQLQEPIAKILDKFKAVNAETARSKSLWLRISRFIPVFNFLLLLLLGFFCYKWTGNLKKNPTENQKELSTELSQTKEQLEKYQQEIIVLKDSLGQLKKQLVSNPSTAKETAANNTIANETQHCTITMTDSEGNVIKNGATLYEGTIVRLSVLPKVDGYCWYGKRMNGIDGLGASNVEGILAFWKSDNDNNRDNQTVSIFYGPHSKNAKGAISTPDETNKVTLTIKRK